MLDEILAAYSQGFFLMDNGDGAGLQWYRSRRHALIPLDGSLHVPRSLRRALNSGRFETRINSDFVAVVNGCAARKETWITEELKNIYLALHVAGHASSFEVWHEDELAGGILGICLGGAFIGESMFYKKPEASKVGLVRLVEHLSARGFGLFDAQVQNPHLARFGAFEISEPKYKQLLKRVLLLQAKFDS